MYLLPLLDYQRRCGDHMAVSDPRPSAVGITWVTQWAKEFLAK
jgi:hypothetical protein